MDTAVDVITHGGATIAVTTVGDSGPGVVVVHGAMQAGESQRDLAELLAGDGFTEQAVWRNGGTVSGRGDITISFPSPVDARYAAIEITRASGLSFAIDEVEVRDAAGALVSAGKLYVADTSGGGYVDLGMGQNPAWSADGRFLIYEVVSDDGHDLTNCDLWISSRDGKFKQRVTSTDGLERYPNWSPDGKSIIYEMDGKIYVMPIELK